MMHVSILVITPLPAFGELLRISLEDNGQYHVRLVASGSEACQAAGKGVFQLAILDTAISDMPFEQVYRKVMDQQKNISMVVIPPDNNPNHPLMGNLLPHAYIFRPFYLPDFMDTIASLLEKSQAGAGEVDLISPTLPYWLQNPELMRQYLEKEMGATSAVSALIVESQPASTRHGAVASAGHLPEAGIKELSSVVLRSWNRVDKLDIMRFIRLSSENKDFLVYATHMTCSFILVLLYPSTYPLSQIRPQSRSLAQTIATLPPAFDGKKPEEQENNRTLAESEAENSDGPPGTHTALPEKMENYTGMGAVSSPYAIRIDETLADSTPDNEPIKPQEFSPRVDEEVQQSLSEVDFAQRTQSFAQYSGWVQEDISPNETEDPSQNEAELAEGTIPDLSEMLGDIPLPDPEMTAEEKDPTGQPNDRNPGSEFAVAPVTVSQGCVGATHPIFAVEREIDPLKDTRPHIVSAITSLSQLEPVSPALSQLKYTCVLIPRLPQHFLSGSLADLLPQWINQVCLAFGWRLDSLSIRPEYIQWTVQVAPSISPGNIVRIIRQRLSFYIFNQNPHFREQNPSGDFWAAGYLIVSGAHPPSAQLLREYIDQTRRRQGLS